MKPLLFVCLRVPAAGAAAARVEFIPRTSPDGPVLQAFESLELATLTVHFDGILDNVFLLPETDLTPEQSAQLDGERVLVYRTPADYGRSDVANKNFPWADRIVRYDPRSRKARGIKTDS